MMRVRGNFPELGEHDLETEKNNVAASQHLWTRDTKDKH